MLIRTSQIWARLVVAVCILAPVAFVSPEGLGFGRVCLKDHLPVGCWPGGPWPVGDVAGTRAALVPVEAVGCCPVVVPFLGALGRLCTSVRTEAGGQLGWFYPFSVLALQAIVTGRDSAAEWENSSWFISY